MHINPGSQWLQWELQDCMNLEGDGEKAVQRSDTTTSYARQCWWLPHPHRRY